MSDDDGGPGSCFDRGPLRGVEIDRLVSPIFGFLDDLGATVLLAGRTLAWAVRPPFRLAQLLIALDFIGAGSTFIVALVGLFTGMAFTVSTIVGFRRFSAEGMVGGVVALALARELAPVLAAVVVTARAGSTMASELGNMRVTEQIDAITTMGVSPEQYLVGPRVIATTIMMPLLATCFGVAGQLGAYVVAVMWQGIDPGVFFDKIKQFLEPDLWMMVVKSLVFGLDHERDLLQEGFFRLGRRARRRRGHGQVRRRKHRRHLRLRLRTNDSHDRALTTKESSARRALFSP